MYGSKFLHTYLRTGVMCTCVGKQFAISNNEETTVIQYYICSTLYTFTCWRKKIRKLEIRKICEIRNAFVSDMNCFFSISHATL